MHVNQFSAIKTWTVHVFLWENINAICHVVNYTVTFIEKRWTFSLGKNKLSLHVIMRRPASDNLKLQQNNRKYRRPAAALQCTIACFITYLLFKLNDPDSANAELQILVNQEVVYRIVDMRLRDSSDLKIDSLFFSTFFGGSSEDYACAADTYIYFKNFHIYEWLCKMCGIAIFFYVENKIVARTFISKISILMSDHAGRCVLFSISFMSKIICWADISEFSYSWVTIMVTMWGFVCVFRLICCQNKIWCQNKMVSRTFI